MDYCGSGESWLLGNEGYENYLDLWPTGPRADEAFWHTRIEPPCCDECGREFLDDPDRERMLLGLHEFIRKFPESPLRRKAEGRIEELRDGEPRAFGRGGEFLHAS